MSSQSTSSSSTDTPSAPYPGDAAAAAAATNPGVWGVIKGLGVDDFKSIGQVPCARNSFLYGIGAGTGMGVLRFAFRGHVLSASNWAVATFCLVSAGSWEVCRYQMKKHHTRVHTLPRAGATPVVVGAAAPAADETKHE